MTPTVLLLLACAPDRPVTAETEGRPSWDGEWSAARGAHVTLQDGLLRLELGEQDRILAEEVVGAPALSADGRRIALAHRGPGPGLSVLDAVEITDAGVEVRRLVDEGAPDRVALTPDGDTVAYVHNATGIASVWVIPFIGGTPTQLTNVDLVRIPGQEPVGFVPPPHDGPLRIDGDRITWIAPDGPHAVALP
jgi:hypothetical protein